MIAVGAGLTTTFGPNTNTSQWVGYQLIQGIGRGAALTMVSYLAFSIRLRLTSVAQI